MKILVTAGGTSEPIDQVRVVTNMATGRLGSLVADAFAGLCGAGVTYLCAEDACRPTVEVERVVPIRGVLDLERSMEGLLRETPFDAVIHTMAVSDYLPRRVCGGEELAGKVADALMGGGLPRNREELTQKILDAVLQCGVEAGGAGKLSSRMEYMVLLMEQAPKVIRLVKRLRPAAVLVGFKLLAGVEEESLLQVASALMEKNECDYVLANNLDHIGEGGHQGLMLGPGGVLCRLSTKEEIARAIVKEVSAAVRRNAK